MRINKSYWLAASGTLAVASAIMLFSAHRIEAQYASPVKVLNTSSGPVLNSRIDDPGRIPYVGFANATTGSNVCFFTFQAVPAGHRVVIQHVSGFLTLNAPPTVLAGSLTAPGINNFFFSVPPAPTGNSTSFDQPILYFVDGGQAPQINISSGAVTFNPSSIQGVTLVGYELDCTAAPCAAVANH
jgi:hypothetical protein